MPPASELWRFAVWGYLVTVAMEAPVLLAGLSPVHRLSQRLLAAVWLTACTYPIVAVVLPMAMWPEGRFRWWQFLLVAETFAPLAECLLFHWAFHRHGRASGQDQLRDFAAIVAANLFSFLGIEAARAMGWISW